MPELAEVEYFRKRWDPGIGDKVIVVQLHAEKRIFSGTGVAEGEVGAPWAGPRGGVVWMRGSPAHPPGRMCNVRGVVGGAAGSTTSMCL